jgi:hypothetical protein
VISAASGALSGGVLIRGAGIGIGTYPAATVIAGELEMMDFADLVDTGSCQRSRGATRYHKLIFFFFFFFCES